MSKEEGGDRKRSLQRSKKSAMNMVTEAAKEGCSLVTPGGALFVEGIKVLVQHGMKFYQDRQQARIDEFNRRILEGAEDISDQANFSMDDYVQLLSSAVQDEENLKVGVYSRLFKALQAKKVPVEYRAYFLKTSRSLLYSDFILMRKLYIEQKYSFWDNRTAGLGLKRVKKRLTSLTVTDQPKPAVVILKLAQQRLVGLGYLKEGERVPRPTGLLTTLIEAIYEDEELQPATIGRVGRKKPCALIYFDPKNMLLLENIADALNNLEVQNVVSAPRHSFDMGRPEVTFLFTDMKTVTDADAYANLTIGSPRIVTIYLPDSVDTSAHKIGGLFYIMDHINGIDGVVKFIIEVINRPGA